MSEESEGYRQYDNAGCVGNDEMYHNSRKEVNDSSIFDAYKNIISNKGTKEIQTLLGKGIFDFTKLFSVLIGNGFDGAGLIEVYSNNYDSYDELAKSYDYLNECLYKAKNNGGI